MENFVSTDWRTSVPIQLGWSMSLPGFEPPSPDYKSEALPLPPQIMWKAWKNIHIYIKGLPYFSVF
jgi:hypothetical protein